MPFGLYSWQVVMVRPKLGLPECLDVPAPNTARTNTEDVRFTQSRRVALWVARHELALARAVNLPRPLLTHRTRVLLILGLDELSPSSWAICSTSTKWSVQENARIGVLSHRAIGPACSRLGCVRKKRGAQ